MSSEFKCGVIGLVGLANAGKSTLINSLLGEKISIVSDKPQTTRNIIRGILTKDLYQMIFIDTPGTHMEKSELNKRMAVRLNEIILTVDLLCLVTDPAEKINRGYKDLLRRISEANVPVILVLTKSDNRSKQTLFQSAEILSKVYDFAEIVPVSAKDNINIDRLLEVIYKYLPEGNKIYSEDEITTQSEYFLVSEYVREGVFALLKQELPYDVLVVTDNISDTDDKVIINSSIIVSRDSQKGIVIGKKGAMLKEIGIRARQELEKYYDKKVRINLTVKVKDGWASKDEYLKMQGL